MLMRAFCWLDFGFTYPLRLKHILNSSPATVLQSLDPAAFKTPTWKFLVLCQNTSILYSRYYIVLYSRYYVGTI